METVIPICLACIYYFRNQNKSGRFCNAFPEGIPEKIYHHAYDHRKPFEGDNGIRFKLKEGREEALDLYLERLEERKRR